MFYGRLSREEGRWITICPSPSSLINSHIARPDHKLEQPQRLPSGQNSVPAAGKDKKDKKDKKERMAKVVERGVS